MSLLGIRNTSKYVGIHMEYKYLRLLFASFHGLGSSTTPERRSQRTTVPTGKPSSVLHSMSTAATSSLF